MYLPSPGKVSLPTLWLDSTQWGPEESPTKLFGPHRKALAFLRQETNPILLGQGLLSIAQHLIRDGYEQGAGQVLAGLSDPQFPDSVRHQAHESLAMLQGQGGGFGDRLELFFQRLGRELFRPANVVPMLLSPGAGQCLGRAMLRPLQWVAPIAPPVLGPMVSVATFVAEAAAFTTLAHGTRVLTEAGRFPDAEHWVQATLQTAGFLLPLKGFSFLVGHSPSLPLHWIRGAKVGVQGGLFGALLLGHGVQNYLAGNASPSLSERLAATTASFLLLHFTAALSLSLGEIFPRSDLRQAHLGNRAAISPFEVFEMESQLPGFSAYLARRPWRHAESSTQTLRQVYLAVETSPLGVGRGSYPEWLLHLGLKHYLSRGKNDVPRLDELLVWTHRGGTLQELETMLALHLPRAGLAETSPALGDVPAWFRLLGNKADRKLLVQCLNTMVASPLGHLRMARLIEVLRNERGETRQAKMRELGTDPRQIRWMGETTRVDLPTDSRKIVGTQWNAFFPDADLAELVAQLHRQLPQALAVDVAATRRFVRKQKIMAYLQGCRLEGALERLDIIAGFRALGDPLSEKIAGAIERESFTLKILTDAQFNALGRAGVDAEWIKNFRAIFEPPSAQYPRGLMVLRSFAWSDAFFGDWQASHERAADRLFEVMGDVVHEYEHFEHMDADVPRTRDVVVRQETLAELRELEWKAWHGEVDQLRELYGESNLSIALQYRHLGEHLWYPRFAALERVASK